MTGREKKAMKHILYATTGIALALAFAGTAKPVMADVDVFASITKDKDIIVFERITVTKDVSIVVGSVFTLDGAAEAQTLMNVTNTGNEVDGQDVQDDVSDPDDTVDEYGIHLSATLDDSMNDNSGVWGLNQDVGNMTNQGNVVSVAGVSNETEAVADAQAHVEQDNTNNTVTELELLRNLDGEHVTNLNTPPEEFLVNKLASITDSINDNSGITNVNQNSGNMNNQSNGVAAAIGFGTVVALSDADLGQYNANNHVDELETVKRATIEGSINGNSGIVNVNQSAGNMNNQGNVVSIAANVSSAFINTGGD